MEKVRAISNAFYGLTHLLSENICSYYNQKYRLDWQTVRLANSYGEPVLSSSEAWG